MQLNLVLKAMKTSLKSYCKPICCCFNSYNIKTTINYYFTFNIDISKQ